MKNRIIIAFFNSENLGDRLLAKRAIEIYTNSNINLIGIDFTTGSIIDCENYNAFTQVTKKGINRKSSKVKINRNNILYKYLSLTKYIKNRYVLKNIYLNGFNKLRYQIDEVVFTTGNMIMDVNPAWPFIIKDFINFFKNSNIYFSYVGVGPLEMKINKIILKKALANVDYFSVRDKNSKIELKNLGFNNIKITLDPILYDYQIDHYKGKRNQLGICLLSQICFKDKKSYKNYINFLDEILHYLNDNNLEYVVFSTDTSDYETMKYLKNLKENNKFNIITEEDLNDLYNSFYYLIGGRMHSMILAQSKKTPYCGINWQKKVEQLFINTNNSSLLEIDNLSSEKVIKYITTLNQDILSKMNSTNIINNQIIVEGSLIERFDINE